MIDAILAALGRMVPWWARWLGVLALVAAAAFFAQEWRAEWDAGVQAEVDLTRTQREDAARAALLEARANAAKLADQILADREDIENQKRRQTERSVAAITEANDDACLGSTASRSVLQQLRAVPAQAGPR